MEVEEKQNVGYISEKIKEWKPKKIRHACSSYCRQKERIHTRPMYLSPIYENMRKKRKQMMQPMTARAILAFVQGRWTVSSWFPHFEHLGFFDKALAISILYFLRILVMELFEGFHPEWEKCTWKKAADTCEKPGNQYFKY